MLHCGVFKFYYSFSEMEGNYIYTLNIYFFADLHHFLCSTHLHMYSFVISNHEAHLTNTRHCFIQQMLRSLLSCLDMALTCWICALSPR